jgi:sortase A
MGWPILPEINWWLKHNAPVISIPASNTPLRVTAPPTVNTLVIPKLDLKQEIYEGAGLETADKGVWRRPATATPEQTDNTVLVGHRFTYKGQGVFYFLDKLQVGDTVITYWNGKEYTYKVRSMDVVAPSEISVEAHTSKSTLTLYTCTPLWTSKSRLVVTADLVGVSP